MFRHYTQEAQVLRMSYTTDSGFKKSEFLDIGTRYSGHLKARTINAVVDTASFGREFTFTTENDADIQESDRLIIDDVSYDVKGFAPFRGLSFSTKQCLLTLSENEPVS